MLYKITFESTLMNCFGGTAIIRAGNSNEAHAILRVHFRQVPTKDECDIDELSEGAGILYYKSSDQ